MAWLHAVQFPWSGLRCGLPFATGSESFPETRLDVTMQGLFYQTSTPIFQSSCFFNNFRLRRAPTIVGPPLGTNSLAQWHGDVHERNMRVDHWSFGITPSPGRVGQGHGEEPLPEPHCRTHAGPRGGLSRNFWATGDVVWWSSASKQGIGGTTRHRTLSACLPKPEPDPALHLCEQPPHLFWCYP